MGFLGKAVKKSVKRIQNQYVRYSRRKNERYFSDSDEHIYESVPLAPESRRNSTDFTLNSTFTIQPDSSPPIPPKLRYPIKSHSSNDNLDDHSADSGIVEASSPEKKLKKLHFALGSVQEDKNAFQKRSRPVRRSNAKRMSASLYRAKYFEAASPQRPEILTRSHEEQNENSSENIHPLHYVDPRDLVRTTDHYSVPVGRNSPFKPQRSGQKHRKFSFNNQKRISTLDESGYSVAMVEIAADDVSQETSHVKTDYDQLMSNLSLESDDVVEIHPLPKISAVEPPKAKTEPIYAQVTPRSSRNLEKFNLPKSYTPLSSNCSTPEPRSEECPFSSKSSLSKRSSSLEDLPGPSSDDNDFLTQQTKESLSLIHNTTWSLKPENIFKDHDCQMEKKSPERLSLDRKFVINMFESRPSKRWEKHRRDIDRDENDGFQKQAFIRMSLDSKMMAKREMENNSKRLSRTNYGMKQNAEMLERESWKLETETKEIKKELKPLLHEDSTTRFNPSQVDTAPAVNKNDNKNSREEKSLQKHTEQPKQTEEDDLETPTSENNEQRLRYNMLKETRDVECSRMAQTSRALEEIKSKRGKKDWLGVLIAEKVLLETNERVKLLSQQIADISYTTIPQPPLHKGTLHLSNIKFPFANQFQGNHKSEKHFTEFFLMTVSHGDQLFVSEFITGEEDPLSFQHEYTFKDVAPDFEIKIKLFCLRLRTSDEFFWEKFTCPGFCSTSKIFYEDHLIHQYQEKTVFQTSFKLCAEATLLNSQIDEPSTKLRTDQQVFEKLDDIVEHVFKCEEVDMSVSLSGFLDVGTLLGETYFWERKWCTLKGPNLFIYNYPQDEDFGKPVEQINLEYCFGPIVTKVDNCPRRRCFHLKTGRPNDASPQNTTKPTATLRSKPNFALRKFYFAARTRDEYLRWTVEVEKLLRSLNYFKKLVFDHEYDEYVRA